MAMEVKRAILPTRPDRTRRILLATLGVAASAAGTLRVAEAADKKSLQRDGREPIVLVVGDSLSAGYGLARDEGWVRLLEARTAPLGWRVVNASISGDTSSGGLARLPALLERHRPGITIIELGANDALRGLPIPATEANLRKMLGLARDAGSMPLLIGMMMPPNFGRAFSEQFSGMYHRIAKEEDVALVPFLLDGFGDDLAWFQPDRIHPAAKAQPRMLDNVWPVLKQLL